MLSINIHVDNLLSNYSSDIQEVELATRLWLLQHLPGVQEIPDEPAKIIGFEYGPGYKDMVCTIILSKKGIKLGLNKGASLRDPAQLLKGTGKVHKYVVINSNNDLNNPALLQLLIAANQARAERQKS